MIDRFHERMLLKFKCGREMIGRNNLFMEESDKRTAGTIEEIDKFLSVYSAQNQKCQNITRKESEETIRGDTEKKMKGQRLHLLARIKKMQSQLKEKQSKLKKQMLQHIEEERNLVLNIQSNIANQKKKINEIEMELRDLSIRQQRFHFDKEKKELKIKIERGTKSKFFTLTYYQKEKKFSINSSNDTITQIGVQFNFHRDFNKLYRSLYQQV